MPKKIDGKYLKKLRVEAGLTQAELAGRLKVSRETVIAHENNRIGTIDTIKMSIVKDWPFACRHAPQSVLDEFAAHVKSYLNIK